MQRRPLGRDLELTIRMAVAFTLLCVLYAAIVAVAYGLYRLWPHGAPRDGRAARRTRGDPGAAARARRLGLTVSRYREFAADRGSALLTGRPQDLMSALSKLAGATSPKTDLRLAGVEALCIVPVSPRRWSILMDHPALERRLGALAEIARDFGRVDD